MGCRWIGRQTDGPRGGHADFHWLSEIGAPRQGPPQSDCLRSTTLSCGRNLEVQWTNLCLALSGFPPLRLQLPPQPHIFYTQSTHSHTATPAHRGGPPCRSLVTLPETRQVVIAEWAREHQPTAKGSVPVGKQLTDALPQCRVHA